MEDKKELIKSMEKSIKEQVKALNKLMGDERYDFLDKEKSRIKVMIHRGGPVVERIFTKDGVIEKRVL